jgi:uncharacterized repeat protein (TIGR03803 family)
MQGSYRAALGAAVVLAGAGHAFAGTMNFPYTFDGFPSTNPAAGLTIDASGNFYGSTPSGSGENGSVFKYVPGGAFTVLSDFRSSNNGTNPVAEVLLQPNDRVLFGTAETGGKHGGSGTVYRVSQTGKTSHLYVFTGGNDGGTPVGALVGDASTKTLYGVTRSGGALGNGTVWALSPGGVLTTLHAFAGGTTDGGSPGSGLWSDGAGNFYGTTVFGGTANCGTIYKVTSAGSESILHNFLCDANGANPPAPLVADSEGNLYGVAGTLFKLTPGGTYSVLHSFKGKPTDGSDPQSAVLLDAAGDIFGVTSEGGKYNHGTLYELAANGTYSVLYSFVSGNDGTPIGRPIEDASGNIWGTVIGDGEDSSGAIYEYVP